MLISGYVFFSSCLGALVVNFFLFDIMITKDKIYDALKEVMDPEIPKLSVVDLGVITNVEISSDNTVLITMTPTFAGCPALTVMKEDIKAKLEIPSRNRHRRSKSLIR